MSEKELDRLRTIQRVRDPSSVVTGVKKARAPPAGRISPTPLQGSPAAGPASSRYAVAHLFAMMAATAVQVRCFFSDDWAVPEPYSDTGTCTGPEERR